MNSYELYNRVLTAMDEDEGTFNAAAKNWIENGKEPKFQDDDANELYYTAKMACNAWRNKAINGRVSKGRMIECVRKIAEKKLDNPYDPNEKIEEPESYYVKELEAAINKDNKVHVLGVVPDELQENINAVDTEGSISGRTIEEIKTEEKPKEEPKEEKRFFGKRKNK